MAICTWNAFGPKTYTRPIEQQREDGRHGEDGDDHSVVFTDSFTIHNIATQYKLHIVAEEGTRAEIVLNSRRIVDEDDFAEHRGDEEREGRAECHEGEEAKCRSGSGNKEPEIVTIDKAIHPLASNVLQIRLHGRPGAQIGSGPVLGAFDFTARTQRWASQSTGGQSFPVVATADGGLLAQKTSSRFGTIDSVLSFDPSGAATTFPTTTGISYFSDNTLQGFPNGALALFLPPVPIATDPGNIWSPIAGNLYQQHAPTPPQVTFNKKVVKAGISLINKDVRGTISATIKPKSAASHITFTSTNKARATVSEEGPHRGNRLYHGHAKDHWCCCYSSR